MAERVLEIVALAEKPYPYNENPSIMNYVSRPPLERDQARLKAAAAEIEASGK